MHPSSINSQPDKAESGLYVYLEKQETTRLFLRGTSRVPPAALLLFGAQPDDLDVRRRCLDPPRPLGAPPALPSCRSPEGWPRS